MNNGITHNGRVNQKRRTRNAVLEAAAALLRGGMTPSVADAADAAGVSRATAYRYFPSQERLLSEAALELTTAQIEGLIAPTADAHDAHERLDGTVHAIQSVALANEGAFRSILRSLLAPPPDDEASAPGVQRGGRRLRWLGEALTPVREQLGPERFGRLVAALSLCVGIESIVVLRDICDLDAAQTEAVSLWAARALLKSSLEEVG